jgi:hypothetical protein
MAETPGPSLCLRCKTVPLNVLQSDAEITFFVCPRCSRQYVRKSGAGLVYRWGHPLTLALYGVICEPDAPPHAARIADQLASGEDPADLERFIREIELELADPTQAVTEILPMAVPKTEENLREFLRLVAVELRRRSVR